MSEKIQLNVGDIAPNFKSRTQTGESIELYELLEKGSKVLLVFYPKDDTPGCTAQLCGIRDIYKEYKDKGVRVLGVNHGSSESHKDFIEKHNYPFDILVDEKKEIIKSYGSEKLFFKNLVVKRGVFLINTDKKIIYRFWGQQDNEKVLQVLDN